MTYRAFDFSVPAMLSLVKASVVTPRAVARQIASLNVPIAILWQLLLAVATVSVLIGQATSMILIPRDQIDQGGVLTSPLLMALIQWGVLVLTVYCVHWIGTLMGGTGRLADTLALMTWLQMVMFAVQILQVAALFLLPGLATLITIFGLVLFLWLLTNFVAAVHEFGNLFVVFVTIIVSALVISFALTLALTTLGFTVNGVAGA